MCRNNCSRGAYAEEVYDDDSCGGLITCYFWDLSIGSSQSSRPYGRDVQIRESVTIDWDQLIIADRDTLISDGGKFELGFFNPNNSDSETRYLGIWYSYKLARTVVWVANRKKPLTDTFGVLAIKKDRGLMILDGRGNSIISLYSGSLTTSTSIKLLDSGNLVFREESSGQLLWQSFDYPMDTLLPGMKLGLNNVTGRIWTLTSWRNPMDPGLGSYSLRMDRYYNDYLSLSHSGVQYNGIHGNIEDHFISVRNENESYFTFAVNHGFYRIVIDYTGIITNLTRLEDIERSYGVWSIPSKLCDVYAPCGAFGVCDEGPYPSCTCLQGFQPRFPSEWDLGAWSGGCVRKTPLQCSGINGEKDKFLVLSNVKAYPHFHVRKAADPNQCEVYCLNNCSCSAYIYEDTCYMIEGDILNLEVVRDHVSSAIHVRLAASDLPSSRGNNKQVWPIILSVLTLLIILATAFSFRRKKLKITGKPKSSEELLLLELGADVATGEELAEAIEFNEGLRKGPDVKVFSFSSVVAATDNFSLANKLGEGGFGPVYKGKFLNGQRIAVKRLSKSSRQGLIEFKNEIILIAKLQHMNLVRLLGCCIEGEEKMLLYEYMPNKSLDSFLFDPTTPKQLDWEKRIHIIEGIAQGLLYLHKYSRLKIIHRDLKASNILLDGDMNPKISDFGLARIFGRNELQANTNRIVGTYGYMSPEYGMEGLFSEKSDVFSFGVLLLEIVSGKKNTSFYNSDRSLNLLGYAWELWRNGKGLDLLDPTLGDSAPSLKVMRCIHVGLLCVEEKPTDRPTMSDIILMLNNESVPLQNPAQPAFFFGREMIDANSPRNGPSTSSNNEVTLSDMEGR